MKLNRLTHPCPSSVRATIAFLALAASVDAAGQAAPSGQAPSTAPSTSAAKQSKKGAKPTESTKAERRQTAGGGIATRAGYRLAAGDVIDVLVWKEPDASVSGLLIRADGKVSLPFLREVAVAGMTPSELEDKLTVDFGKVVKDPEVTVLVKQVNSEKVYLVGAVRKPGPLPMPGNLTVLQAITEAGGPSDFAKKKKIYILRSGQRIPFNYDDVIKGQNMDSNIQLLPGDTVVVPQ